MTRDRVRKILWRINAILLMLYFGAILLFVWGNYFARPEMTRLQFLYWIAPQIAPFTLIGVVWYGAAWLADRALS